jgi:putative oxidoreductase
MKIFKDFTPSLLFCLRLWLGFMMMMHSYEDLFVEGIDGFSKYVRDKLGFPAPTLLAYLAKGSEFFGGLMALLGLFTRIAAALIVLTMSVAVFWAHRNSILGHGELALNYLLIGLALFWQPQTIFSLDNLILKRRFGGAG